MKTKIDTVFIYILSDPRDGRVRYVGKANDIGNRIRSHLRDSRRSHKSNWINSLRIAGLIPSVEIVEEVSMDDWAEAERFWIAYFRFLGFYLTNIESGGNGPGRMSRETIDKMSSSRTGVPRSPETIAKMKVSMKGLKKSPEACENMRRVRLGVPLSEEHKLNIGKSIRNSPKFKEAMIKIHAAQIGRPRPDGMMLRLADLKRGKKRPPFSPEWRSRMSASATNVPKSPTAIKNMIAAQQKRRMKERNQSK